MCVICSELRAPQLFHRIARHPWPWESRVLFTTGNVVAIPGIGPLVYPYVLLVTQRHIDALAETKPDELEDIFRALAFLESSGVFPSGRLAVFEHGGCTRGSASCIDHFHLHVIDSKYSVEPALIADYEVNPLSGDAHGLALPQGGYLFAGGYESGKIHGSVAQSSDASSQYFRQRLSELAGQPHWNWRLQMNSHWMSGLMEAFSQRTGAEHVA